MSHLDTSYKLGSVQAAEDFEAWLQNSEYDNPTEAPPKMAATIAVKKALENLEKIGEPKGPATRRPTGSGSRFQALKSKLSRKKGVRNPGGLAASIGRSKFGKKKFQSMGAKRR